MQLSVRPPWSVCLLAVIVISVSAYMPPESLAHSGSRLAAFVPKRSWSGRALAISGSTAYLSSTGEGIQKVSLLLHTSTGHIDTSGQVPQGFDALAFDQSGALWASAYADGKDPVYRIDLAQQMMNRVIDAHEILLSKEKATGLAPDSDGTLWLKGSGSTRTSSTIYHVAVVQLAGSYDYKLIRSFRLPFPSSGIAVDGPYLWLADPAHHKIYEYDKQGKRLHVKPIKTGSYNGQPVTPEGLALDHCTFPGKLALWTYGASTTGGPLIAYQLRDITRPSDCPARAQEEASAGGWTVAGSASSLITSPTGEAASPMLHINDGATSGRPVLLEGLVPGDSTGHAYRYLWNLGDGDLVVGLGRVLYTYKCAGVYEISVTAFGANDERHVSTGRLTVGFPPSATKTYHKTRITPHVRVLGHHATAWLTWSGRPVAKAGSVEWTLGHQHDRRLPPRTKASSAIALAHDHSLSAVTRFREGHTTAIHACFHA